MIIVGRYYSAGTDSLFGRDLMCSPGDYIRSG